VPWRAPLHGEVLRGKVLLSRMYKDVRPTRNKWFQILKVS